MNHMRAVVVALATAALCLIAVTSAFADAADPVPSATTGTLVTNSDGSRTLTVQGRWQWTTHHSDCNTDRAGVGVAIDWNDPTDAGNDVKGFGLGTSTDNVVHP